MSIDQWGNTVTRVRCHTRGCPGWVDEITDPDTGACEGDDCAVCGG